jgi:hypothetical protein
VKNFAKDLPYTKSTRIDNMNHRTNLKRLTRTHKNMQYNLRFGNHHKGVLLLVEEPTKGRVFSNPNPPQADHKVQGNLFSNKLKERVIQTSWGRPQIWRLPIKQPLTVKEHEVPRVTNPHKVKFATSSRTKRIGESR